MYKITATVNKAGNTPASWIRFSATKLTKEQCETMLSGKTEAGVSRVEKVKLTYFKCVKAGK